MKILKRSILPILIILVMFAVSCASTDTNIYKALSVSYTTYDTTMSMAGDLYKQGKITDGQKDDIVNLGNLYKSAHNETITLFKKAVESGLTSDQQDYIEKLSNASVILADLISYIQPFISED